MDNPAPLIAGLLALYICWKHFHVDRRSCVQCGGINGHRRRCPFNKDDEE